MKQFGAEWAKERSREDADCLIWRMACNPGGQPKYSSKREDGGTKTIQVRRTVWEDAKGKIPAGLLVTMTCGNVKCVNPDHMKLATKSEVVAKVARNPVTQARRFLAGVNATRDKLGKLDMEKARYIRASDRTLEVLARELGVSISLVSRVRRGTSWREVSAPNPFAGLFSANDSRRKAA
jgi:hypothetical protein